MDVRQGRVYPAEALAFGFSHSFEYRRNRSELEKTKAGFGISQYFDNLTLDGFARLERLSITPSAFPSRVYQ